MTHESRPRSYGENMIMVSMAATVIFWALVNILGLDRWQWWHARSRGLWRVQSKHLAVAGAVVSRRRLWGLNVRTSWEHPLQLAVYTLWLFNIAVEHPRKIGPSYPQHFLLKTTTVSWLKSPSWCLNPRFFVGTTPIKMGIPASIASESLLLMFKSHFVMVKWTLFCGKKHTHVLILETRGKIHRLPIFEGQIQYFLARLPGPPWAAHRPGRLSHGGAKWIQCGAGHRWTPHEWGEIGCGRVKLGWEVLKTTGFWEQFQWFPGFFVLFTNRSWFQWV